MPTERRCRGIARADPSLAAFVLVDAPPSAESAARKIWREVHADALGRLAATTRAADPPDVAAAVDDAGRGGQVPTLDHAVEVGALPLAVVGHTGKPLLTARTVRAAVPRSAVPCAVLAGPSARDPGAAPPSWRLGPSRGQGALAHAHAARARAIPTRAHVEHVGTQRAAISERCSGSTRLASRGCHHAGRSTVIGARARARRYDREKGQSGAHTRYGRQLEIPLHVPIEVWSVG